MIDPRSTTMVDGDGDLQSCESDIMELEKDFDLALWLNTGYRYSTLLRERGALLGRFDRVYDRYMVREYLDQMGDLLERFTLMAASTADAVIQARFYALVEYLNRFYGEVVETCASFRERLTELESKMTATLLMDFAKV